MSDGARPGGRLILALLTLYAIAMIAPDYLRIFRPLGSIGMTVDANGRIFEVQGPFDTLEESPAWRAGLRPGDRLDLAKMRCTQVDSEFCAATLAIWGGVTFLLPGREVTFVLLPDAAHPARTVALTAEPRPSNWLLRIILLFQQTAGIAVILGAAWLVWIRPGPMTWGFFAYMMYFNPGQVFFFWAWLQQWPKVMLVQSAFSCLQQAAGYTGLILFALRAPIDRVEGVWRRVERALPVLATGFLLVSLATLGSLFGHPAELAMRASTLLGFAVSIAAVAILIGRRHLLSPRDYQRIRWVIWGALIGLPAFLFAELLLETSLLDWLVDDGAALEELTGALFTLNGILCLFVVEAVRRPTVVNVAIPLRRATILGIVLSLPTLLLHRQIEVIDEYFRMPEWAWLLVASGFVYLLARLHELATEAAERLFDLRFRRAEERLHAVGAAVERAESFEAIERILVEEPVRTLHLSSAAVFHRDEDGGFRRGASQGWDDRHIAALPAGHPLVEVADAAEPRRVGGIASPGLPDDLGRPVLAAPVANPRRCFAVVLYSGHEAGTDLDRAERTLLGELARRAEVAWAQVEDETLRARVAALEDELAVLRPAAATPARASGTPG
ncbi:MAG: hypothetical protein U1E59_07730 [Amaricoccus sp.]